ncbi:WAT1-related protein At3g30340 [Musa acuminata AAA Group]|uniref:WAT1-related protein At3g30340 n=1 Tax=Musa acuminata AAA Group TaxID=214697 RepID=UPI0031DB09C4
MAKQQASSTDMDVGMGWWGKWKPVLVMLAIVVAYAVMNIMIKKAIDEGTNRLLLITLRQLIAALILSPIAYFRERKTRPPLTADICVHLFFSAALGAALTQYLFLLGLQYTSATFACAFANILPVLTFLMALLFRLETLNLKRTAGIAKAIGAAVCIAGAMLLSLYKGVALTSSPHPSRASEPRPTHLAVDYTSRQCLMATVALFAACVCYSSWFLVQSKVGKKYPALYSGAALVFLISFLQAAALSLAIQRSFSMWILKTKLELITVLYSGIVGSGIGFLAMSWCVEKRGPLFTSAFTPLIQIIVAVIDTSVLHERIYLGSVLGSALVILGLYFLLWGKSKEARNSEVKPAEGNEENKVQLQTV